MSLLKELKNSYLTEDLSFNLEYHDKLNHLIWDKNDKMKRDVRKKLEQIVELFEESLKVPNLEILDVVVTGSIANYNWHKKSDIDVHLIVDFNKVLSPKQQPFTTQYFIEKKHHWSEKHHITIHGFDVEMTVEDVKHKARKDEGLYSLKDDKWIIKPVYKEMEVDKPKVEKLANQFVVRIDDVLNKSKDINKIKKIKDDIKKLRKKGLDMEGEFSVENLAFKILRNNGYIKKLKDYYVKIVDEELSLK